MPKSVVLAVIVSCVSPVACGGSGGGSSGPPLTVRETWEAYVRVDCAKGHECRASYPGDPADFAYDYGVSVDDCTSELDGPEFAATVQEYEDAVAAGRIVFNGAKARTCFDAWSAQGCVAYWRGDDASPTCGEIFVGQTAAGGACTFGDECVSGICLGSTGAMTCT